MFFVYDDFDIILGDGIKKILTKDYDNVKLNIISYIQFQVMAQPNFKF